MLLDRQFVAHTRNPQLSVLPAVLAEGERLARVYGCTSCHGAQLQGKVLEEGLLVGKHRRTQSHPGNANLLAR